MKDRSSPQVVKRNMTYLRKALLTCQRSLNASRQPGPALLGTLLMRATELRNRSRYNLAKQRPGSEDGKILAARGEATRRPSEAQAEIYERLLEASMICLEDANQGTITLKTCDLCLGLLLWDEVNPMELLGRMAK
jgi:hypothetical protein